MGVVSDHERLHDGLVGLLLLSLLVPLLLRLGLDVALLVLVLHLGVVLGRAVRGVVVRAGEARERAGREEVKL